MRAEDDQCWFWVGAKANGYGRFFASKRCTGAHQYSFALSGRVLLAGQQVLHTCDVPHCVNPAHLFAGTRKENAQDMVRKGRHRHHLHPEGRPKGEKNGRAKLTHKKVSRARALYTQGWSQQRIAERFGVAQTTISRLLLNRNWA